MLKIDAQFVRKLKLPKGYPMPKPFPGSQPVRIEVSWLVKGRLHYYIGKPNALQALGILQDNSHRIVSFKEFDRKQIIASLAPGDTFSWHKRLFQTYHPGLDGTPFDSFLSKNFWLTSFFRPRKLGKFVFYLSENQEGHLEAATLKVTGLLKGEQGEQIARRLAAAKEARAKSKFNYQEPPF